MMHYNDQYMMHKRAYHQVHRSHDTSQAFFYPTTNVHDPSIYSNNPNVVSVHHYNHQIPQEVLVSPSSRNEVGMSSASSSKTVHPIPVASFASNKAVVDESQSGHVPFEQRLLFSDHNEFTTGFHDHQRNRYQPKQIVSDASPHSWYKKSVEFYPITNHKTSPRGKKYHHFTGSHSDKLVRRVQSFHQNSQPSHQIPRKHIQTLHPDHSQFGKAFHLNPYLLPKNQNDYYREAKFRQPVERHYSTLGHRKNKPVVHQMYPTTKTNGIGIMMRNGGSQNYIHKSQSLRRASPYNIRRFPSSLAYPVSEILHNNHLITISDSAGVHNNSIQSEGGYPFRRDIDHLEAEQTTHSMPSSFARRFNSSIRGRKKKVNIKNGTTRLNDDTFDDVLTIQRLSSHEIDCNSHDEIHTLSLDSKQNSLPNPKHPRNRDLLSSPRKQHPVHFIKINNYVGSLDRIKQPDAKEIHDQKQLDAKPPKMQSLDYKPDNYSRNEDDNSILSLGKNPLNIISSTLSNIAESPLKGNNSKYLRSDYRKRNLAKKSSSFSSAMSSRPTSFHDENSIFSTPLATMLNKRGMIKSKFSIRYRNHSKICLYMNFYTSL